MRGSLCAALPFVKGATAVLTVLGIGFAGSSVSADEGGWFSKEQVAHGTQLYANRCSHCHGDEKAQQFTGWSGTAQELIDAIRSFDMPADVPGGLPQQEYIDIVSYFFSLSGMPEGEEVLAGADLSVIKLPD